MSSSIPKKQFNVFVEGNIASGKSNLLDYLENQNTVKVFPEPLKSWQNLNGVNFFDLYYKDPLEYGLSFQFLTMLTMLKRNIKASENTTKPIHIFERSINSSRYVFAETLRSEKCFDFNSMRILNRWYSFMDQEFKLKPDLIVYIRTTPEKLMKQIEKRGRSEEREIDFDFIKEIHDNYEAWMKSITDTPVIFINGDAEFENQKLEYQQCLTRIKEEFLKNLNE